MNFENKISMLETKSVPRKRICLNVGGTRFQCYSETLAIFPKSKLATLDINSADYDELNSEYYFDRNPLTFGFILDSYRTGTIHLPKDTCGMNFIKELEFWSLSLSHVAPCCWEKLYKAENDIKTIQTLAENYRTNTNMCLLMKNEKTFKENMWLLLDEPKSSKLAMIWGILMCLVIILSTVVSATETVSAVLIDTYTEEEKQTILDILEFGGWFIPGNATTGAITKLTLEPPAVLVYIDICCFIILTFEIILVFVFCPRRRDVMKCWLHLSEILCSISFWTWLAMELNLTDISSSHEMTAYIVFKFLTVLRLVRLFRIAKHIPVFNIMGLTFRSCSQELKVLAIMLSLLTTLFGYIMYTSELFYSSHFDNVFSAMYWALITLTTVGYGDYVPASTFGHVVASICAICGVLVLALPIGVIAASFNSFYTHHKYASKHIQNNKVYPQSFVQ